MTNHPSNIESSRTIKSNEQRLKSLDEYEREKQNKRRLIKDSLTNQVKTTHVKFDSDDEDQDNKPKPFTEKKLQLFDNHDEINIDEHFNDKKQPKKRKKLQDLQTRLVTTNDPRFQLSEKFLDDNEKTIDDDDDDDDEKIIENDQEISFEEEKKKSLAILDQITHKKSSVPKPETKMIRFDPSKNEHKIYELKSDTITLQDTKSKPILKQPKETTSIVDSTRVYEFDESKLKSLFNKTLNTSNENGGFQFEFFSNNEPVTLPTPKPTPLLKPISNGKSKTFLNKPDDTSSDEDDHEPSTLTEEPKVKKEIENKTFFFFDIDDRLKDGLESFVRTEDLDELERSWPAKRKEIGEALRTKHRKAIQRKDKHRVFNHRRRQKQDASSNQVSQSNID